MPLPEIPYDSWFHDKPHPHDSMPIATDEPIDTSPSEIQPPGVDQEDKTIHEKMYKIATAKYNPCLLYTSPSPRDRQKSRMPSSA